MNLEPEIDMGPDPVKLMLVGDSHHNHHWLGKVIDVAQQRRVDTIFQLGDFGFWPVRVGRRSYLDKVNAHLEGTGIRFLWLDGNHEHHSLLVPGFKDRNIQHVPRGYRWQWWGKTWMAVGGAVSPDKNRRTAGHDWFPDEHLSLPQVLHCARPGHVDVILSHDCPDRVKIPQLKSYQFPKNIIDESEAHRGSLGYIVDETGAQWLWHGHYHKHYCAIRQGDNHETFVMGLAKDYCSINTATFTMLELPKAPNAV